MAGKEKEPEVKIPDAEVTVKPPEGYTEQDWSDLSEEERAGIQMKDEDVPGDHVEEEIDEATLAEIAGEESEKKEEKVEKVVEKPGEVKPTVEKVIAEVVKPSEEVVVEKPEVKPSETPGRISDDELRSFRAVVPDSELPTVDSVSPEIQTKLDQLDEKYDAGDLTLKDYNRQRDTLNRQVVMGNVQQREILRTDKAWEKEQHHFLNNRPEYLGELGADGKFIPTSKSIGLFGALSEQIRVMGADPKYSSLSGIDLLIVADKAVRSAFGIVEPSKPNKEVKAKEIEKPTAPLPDHKTLADIPNAAPNTTEDAFSQIDKLNGEAYENALERLSQDQRDRYLDNLRPRLR